MEDPVCCGWEDRQYFGSFYQLEWSHVQLAMQRHRYGPEHGISLANLGFKGCVTKDKPGYAKIEARIINNELFLRKTVSMDITPANFRHEKKVESLRICPHIEAKGWTSSGPPTLLTRCPDIDIEEGFLYQCTHAVSKTCITCTMLRNCPLCYTEFQVERPAEDKMLVTVWYAYGKGESPKDPKWESRSPLEWAGYELKNFEAGSVRGAWESQDQEDR